MNQTTTVTGNSCPAPFLRLEESIYNVLALLDLYSDKLVLAAEENDSEDSGIMNTTCGIQNLTYKVMKELSAAFNNAGEAYERMCIAIDAQLAASRDNP